jgi:hypothetical protein
MQARPDRVPEAMELRRQTIEHPFATLKASISSTHFLTNTLVAERCWDQVGWALEEQAWRFERLGVPGSARRR